MNGHETDVIPPDNHKAKSSASAFSCLDGACMIFPTLMVAMAIVSANLVESIPNTRWIRQVCRSEKISSGSTYYDNLGAALNDILANNASNGYSYYYRTSHGENRAPTAYAAKGAVCLDGSPPAYYFQRGSGSGADRWLVHMEGGGWCRPSCSERARSTLGSSLYMEKSIAFTCVLSGLQIENPDFYNWNHVTVIYCDGSSFTGDLEEGSKLHLRGERIWQAVMEDILAQGMDKAEQALVTGCLAGGLATFIHCDEFRDLLPKSAKVKCMPDAGFFMDSENIAGINSFRSFYDQIVTFHGSLKHLPVACT